MKREWKPGDVALVEAGCWANRKVALRLAEGWAHTNGVNMDGDGVVTAVRPLVVIDPEDREQVERLATACRRKFGWDRDADEQDIDATQAALREFANPTPPKPAEPTGLGAVVEDEEGERWVRIGEHIDCNDWRLVRGGLADGTARDYADITAVRVLSEGVSL